MIVFTNGFKRLLLGMLLAFCSFVANADEWDKASGVVEQSTQAMIDLLKQSRLEAERKSEIAGQPVALDELEILKGMEVILQPVVDFDSIAKGVMAKFYRRASEQQIEKFRIAFKRSLLNTYSRAVVAFKINKFQIQPNASRSIKPDRQKVWVKVYANGAAYDINYAMKKREQGWKVTNVTLDGINLGLAFRQQFANAMAQNKGNMDDVIAFWISPS
ncbi:MAG: ABC transporter substrate-binding protein [Gammaproteobacteria bacterium]|nr:ABC transporter substrate-binding protein [Gammaproteobacteria bacterium]